MELLDCSICLQLLEEPVTTACGHSFCSKCIDTFWNSVQNRRRIYSCPQCRSTFNSRPVLQKNITLSNLLEEHKKKTSGSAAAATADDEEDAASPGDMQCDVCPERKRKAERFCLMCLASYCEEHLQSHFEVPALKKHKLIQATTRIRETICSRHDRRLEMYCRSDEQLLCPLCVLEHKNHDIVDIVAESHEKKRQLDWMRQEIANRLLGSQNKMAQLMEAADSIKDAAWEACDKFERECMEHILLYVHSVEKKCSEMREKVGELEKAGVDWTRGRLGRLEHDVYKLRGMSNKFRQLSSEEDPIRFLQDFHTLDGLPVFTDSHGENESPAEFATKHIDKLKNVCDKEKAGLSSDLKTCTMLKVPRKPHREIQAREDLFSWYTTLELDPDTVHGCLYMTNTKKELSWGMSDQVHPDHPDRFSYYFQALCQNGLQGSHYWEVEWDGGIIELAVSYKGIQRKGSGSDSCFGHNKLSWKLICSSSGCTFWHNNLHRGQIPPVSSRRVGVHLEYDTGRLSFYSVSRPNRLMLLHQIQTSFTEPLYPGFTVDLGATLKICNI